MNKFADVLGSDISLIKTKENFMDIDDYNKMLKFLDWVSVSQPQNGQHIQEEIDKVITPEIIEIQNKYNKKIIETATELYGLEFIDDNTHMLAATIATPGAITPVHTDIIEGLNREKPKEEELIDWRNAWDGYLSCNIYINDDYLDGELFFPNKDISLRPKPGDLLFFPGNEEYEHGVKHVGDVPIRYVIVGFIKEIGHYERNRY